MHGLSYSQMMHGLKQAEVAVDRKVLADLAVHEPKTFAFRISGRTPLVISRTDCAV